MKCRLNCILKYQAGNLENFGTRLKGAVFYDRLVFLNGCEYTMTKNETIALIIEHLVMQGYSDADKFVNYCTMILPMMSTEELQAELYCLE